MSEERFHHYIDITWCRECFISSFMINHSKLKVDVCFLIFIKTHHTYIPRGHSLLLQILQPSLVIAKHVSLNLIITNITLPCHESSRADKKTCK
jgi:hypothetical protein